jgi:hypothetical protein
MRAALICLFLVAAIETGHCMGGGGYGGGGGGYGGGGGGRGGGGL